MRGRFSVLHFAVRRLTPRKTYCILQYMADKSILQVRISPEEKESFEFAAQISGVSLSAWARQALRRTAASELRSMGFKVPFAEALRGKNV